MKRCKDCKWFPWYMYLWFSGWYCKADDLGYGKSEMSRYHNCDEYVRKWWKFWRLK